MRGTLPPKLVVRIYEAAQFLKHLDKYGVVISSSANVAGITAEAALHDGWADEARREFHQLGIKAVAHMGAWLRPP